MIMPSVGTSADGRHAADDGRAATVTRILAYVVCAAFALRLRVPPDLHLGTLVAIALLPVTLSTVRRYRGAGVILGLALAAAFGGILLTYIHAADHDTNTMPMVVEALRIAGIGVGVITLLWARSIIGLYRVALAYGVGGLISVAIDGANFDNLWKFSLSVPITLIVLSLPIATKTVTRQFIAVLALAALSALSDSRSLAATLLIAGALLLIQRRPGSPRRSAWTVVVQIAAVGVGGFLALQAAIVEGILGEEVQARTALQIQTSGSVFTGGRPELGATVALLGAHPLGFGTGTVPSFRDIFIAKEGMAALGYNPLHNGYVDRYMFGTKFEVHSLLGDLWLLGGVLGGALGIAILVYAVYGMAHSIAVGAAAGVALFLGVRTVWDFFFSPIGTTFFTVALCLALLLPPVKQSVTPPVSRIGLT